MVTKRPSNLQGRKILHHSVAYHVIDPTNVAAVNTGTANGPGGRRADDAQDLVNSRPMLMEAAIGKGYDRYADGTGKLIMPGEKIAWDEHIHAAGEEITAGSELGIWFYPKGQEPKKRSYLSLDSAVARSRLSHLVGTLTDRRRFLRLSVSGW